MTSSTIDIWIPYTRLSSRPRLRLFCFPHAGGGASSFRSWSNELPAEIEVCAIQLPGREGRVRETPFHELTPLLQAMEQALLPYLTSRFAFLGHSLGAFTAFEFARLLRRQHDLEPAAMFMSGCRAPQRPNRLPLIHHLPDPEFIPALSGLNCTPKPVLKDLELLEVLLPALRADFRIFENYVYIRDEPLSCPISVFGGTQDKLVDHEDLAAWSEQTESSCTLRLFPGDHLFLFNARALVAKVVMQELEQHVFGLAPRYC